MYESISVIIPAYNEEDSLKDSVAVAKKVLSSITRNYEIIIVDDGSTDNTAIIAKRLASKNKKVTVLSHAKNQGFGKAFKDGIKRASKMFVTGFPADNDIYMDTFQSLLKSRKNDVFVSTYMYTMSDREIVRQICSHFYTAMMNFIFGYKLKYYNGYFICPISMLASLDLKSNGYTLFAEIRIRLLKQGVKVHEIPFHYKPRPHGVSKAFSITNIAQTIFFVPVIAYDIYFG